MGEEKGARGGGVAKFVKSFLSIRAMRAKKRGFVLTNGTCQLKINFNKIKYAA